MKGVVGAKSETLKVVAVEDGRSFTHEQHTVTNVEADCLTVGMLVVEMLDGLEGVNIHKIASRVSAAVYVFDQSDEHGTTMRVSIEKEERGCTAVKIEKESPSGEYRRSRTLIVWPKTKTRKAGKKKKPAQRPRKAKPPSADGSESS